MIRFPVVLALVAAPALAAQSPPENYRVGVVSESADTITWLRPQARRSRSRSQSAGRAHAHG